MNRYRLLKMNSRGGRYYAEESETGLRRSLKTAGREEAEKLLHALNESHRNPHLNRRIAQAYLAGSGPLAATRTWADIAALTDGDVDWEDRLICYNRKKLAARMQENPRLKPPMVKFGSRIEEVLRRRPAKGPLFPYLSTVRRGPRSVPCCIPALIAPTSAL